MLEVVHERLRDGERAHVVADERPAGDDDGEAGHHAALQALAHVLRARRARRGVGSARLRRARRVRSARERGE